MSGRRTSRHPRRLPNFRRKRNLPHVENFRHREISDSSTADHNSHIPVPNNPFHIDIVAAAAIDTAYPVCTAWFSTLHIT